MACINIMFNPDHHMYAPRISFSNDFIVEQPPPSSRNLGPPPDPNFEFSSLGSRPMMAADQLFSKGRLLPLKENSSSSCYLSSNGSRITTLRDELRADDDDNNNNNGTAIAVADAQRPPKGSSKWKGFLGLKKSHCSSKKGIGNADKNGAAFEAADQEQ